MGSGGEEIGNCSADGDAEGATEQTTVFSGGIYHMNLKIVKIMKRRTKSEQLFCWASYKGYLLFIDEQIEYTT
jgi:hypothetical protein